MGRDQIAVGIIVSLWLVSEWWYASGQHSLSKSLIQNNIQQKTKYWLQHKHLTINNQIKRPNVTKLSHVNHYLYKSSQVQGKEKSVIIYLSLIHLFIHQPVASNLSYIAENILKSLINLLKFIQKIIKQSAV